jgi:hypothetical protein
MCCPAFATWSNVVMGLTPFFKQLCQLLMQAVMYSIQVNSTEIETPMQIDKLQPYLQSLYCLEDHKHKYKYFLFESSDPEYIQGYQLDVWTLRLLLHCSCILQERLHMAYLPTYIQYSATVQVPYVGRARGSQ